MEGERERAEGTGRGWRGGERGKDNGRRTGLDVVELLLEENCFCFFRKMY